VMKNALKAAAAVDCAPPHDIMGEPYEKYLPKGRHGAPLVKLMALSREIFRDHPVNKKRRQNGQGDATQVWLWGQGFTPEFPTYYKRFGFHGGVITAVDLLKGIAMQAGLDVIRVPGVTGYFDTNYVGKAEYAVNSLRSRDFVAIHIESTDEAGHIGDVKLKIKAIEDVDRLVLGTLRRALKEFAEYKVMLVPDHYTCVETRTHSRDMVPFFIYSNQNETKGPKTFSERSAKASGFTVKEGHRLMERFVHA
jgi:2,3-bisphosphoglycerate-independent phosphoglycerate mutase